MCKGKKVRKGRKRKGRTRKEVRKVKKKWKEMRAKKGRRIIKCERVIGWDNEKKIEE